MAEVAQGAEHRVGGRLAQAAEAGVLDHIAERLELMQVGPCPDALTDPLQEPVELDRAGAAGDALAAGFVHAEFHEEPGHVDHARVLVHDDHAAGAHDRPDLGQRLVIDGRVEERRRGCSRRRARRSGPP